MCEYIAFRMNLLSLSWKNLRFKPLNTGLSILLFALGVGLISLLFLLEKQLQDNFEKNLAGIDLVVGAKGSPLQLILSSMYHIDAPTGNMTIKEARPFLNPKHPLIETAVPLAMGDSYKGFRIVGSTQDLVGLYEGELAEGALWERDFEVTLGATAARDLGLKIGDRFQSSHGFDDNDDLAHADAEAFKVVGILAPTGAVVDQLIITTPQSYWHVHDHGGGEAAAATEEEEDDHDHEGHDHGDEEEHDHDHEGHDHGDEEEHDHDHEGHDHGDEEEHDHDHEGHDHAGHDHGAPPKPLIEEADDKDITSILIKFKGRNFQALNMGRNINENTDLQAATPAIEINRVFAQMDQGERVLRILGIVIVIVSALSIFISLYSSLKERQYELALMRVMGARPGKLFLLIVLEGLLLAGIGYGLGILMSHVSMEMIANFMKDSYRYSFSGWEFLEQEYFLLLGALIIGFLAALIPAIRASKTPIAETLTKG